jgi:recA bacterial DNA recombination protein
VDWDNPELDEFRPQPRRERNGQATHTNTVPPSDNGAYIDAVIVRELDKLQKTGPGIRNDMLNRVTLRLARLLPIPDLDGLRNGLRDSPIYACHTNGLVHDDGLRSVEATINSAFRAANNYGPAEVPEPTGPAPDVTEVDSFTDHDDRPPLYADVAAFLSGTLPEPPTPTVLTRRDGHALFYRGQVNTVFGDPDSGKTFVTLAACAEELARGGAALFIDLDHNRIPAIVLCLLMIGAPREALADPARFRYTEPDGGLALDAVVADCADWRPGAVMVDSLGELLTAPVDDLDGGEYVTLRHLETPHPLHTNAVAYLLARFYESHPAALVTLREQFVRPS